LTIEKEQISGAGMKIVKRIMKFNYQSTIDNRQWSITLALVILFSGIAVAGPYYGSPLRTAGKGRMLYSVSFIINGLAAEAGDEIGAFDGSGVCRGRFTVREEGRYGFMPVHAGNGEVLNFRTVSKAGKREYVITGYYAVEGSTSQFDTVELDLVTGEEYDSDGDGMCGYWEWFYRANGFDPGSWNDPGGDADGDGWADILEYGTGTSPVDAGSNPGTVRVNFGPGYSPSPDGYLGDSGRPSSGSGYGWR